MLTNVPYIVAKAVFLMSDSQMHICLYVSNMSSFIWNLPCATLWQMLSWSGNGVTSLTVLSFCFWLSTTVRRPSSFFGRHNIGAANATLLLVHHPAVVYLSIFSRSCIFNESGHLGGRYIGLYVGSIRLILCTTSCIGGILSRTRMVKSLMFSIHFF